jgi:predicted naringenin-chalcone synthase
MHLHALATALPPGRYSQAECWNLVQQSDIRRRLNRKSLFILKAVLTGDSGIATRHFATDDPLRLLDLTADELNASFRRAAPALAAESLEKALSEAGIPAGRLDALLVCTCTGYLCPGVTSYVAERLGLRPSAYLQDLVGLGCGAAVPMLRSADALLARHPDWTVATVAVEVCSAAFFLDDDLGVLFSACLFGDGAAAAIWRTEPGACGARVRDFSTLHRPEFRDRIRFEQRDGKLRNLLDPSVPDLAAAAVQALFREENARVGARPITRILCHPGGRDVLRAVATALPGWDFPESREVLRDCGNLSSPSVLFALERALRAPAAPAEDDWWLVAFGAGFSAHGCRFGP